MGRTHECSRGFTLLELIVVIAIIAVASSIAMIEIGKRRDRTLFLDEVRRIAMALKGARQRAVMERAEFSFYTGIDMDGVLYQGERAIPGAREALDWLTSHSLPYLFLTNTTSRPRSALIEKLGRFGIHAEAAQILTPPVAAMHWLANHVEGASASPK